VSPHFKFRTPTTQLHCLLHYVIIEDIVVLRRARLFLEFLNYYHKLKGSLNLSKKHLPIPLTGWQIVLIEQADKPSCHVFYGQFKARDL